MRRITLEYGESLEIDFGDGSQRLITVVNGDQALTVEAATHDTDGRQGLIWSVYETEADALNYYDEGVAH